jgi:hypothetical protein
MTINLIKEDAKHTTSPKGMETWFHCRELLTRGSKREVTKMVDVKHSTAWAVLSR